MALEHRYPAPGIIHHPDQGVQYASVEYVEELHRYGFMISTSRRGNPYDKATMESGEDVKSGHQTFHTATNPA
jgi:transposase InsO family protein